MPDQANPLRRLMLANAAENASRRGYRPWVVLMGGGRRGVGTTTVALNLAVAMGQRGLRTVLVDADSRGGDLAALCRLNDAPSLADVLAGRSAVADALQAGPGGIHVLAGMGSLERISDYPPETCDPVLGPLRALSDTADWVLIDTGPPCGMPTIRMWHAADLMMLITTADDDSVMDAYAAIKTLYSSKPSGSLATLINAVHDSADGEEVHARLAQACRRFLAFEPATIGSVASDAGIRRAASLGEPFVLTMPTDSVTRQVYRVAGNLCSLPTWHRRAA